MPRAGATVEAPERNPPRQAMWDLTGNLLNISPKPELGGEHIGGASGQYTKRDSRVDHPRGHFVDRAVSTCGENAACPLLDGRASDLARSPRPGCGYQLNDVAGAPENGGCALHLQLTVS